MNIIDQINNENVKKEVPSFNVGDTVKVSVKGRNFFFYVFIVNLFNYRHDFYLHNYAVFIAKFKRTTRSLVIF